MNEREAIKKEIIRIIKKNLFEGYSFSVAQKMAGLQGRTYSIVKSLQDDPEYKTMQAIYSTYVQSKRSLNTFRSFKEAYELLNVRSDASSDLLPMGGDQYMKLVNGF